MGLPPLRDWHGVEPPARIVLEGRYARLEPLDASRHGADLFASATQANAARRFRYLFDHPPADLEAMMRWAGRAQAGADPLFFAVVDRATGRAEGRQALMRIDTAHGVIEIGNILWGPAIARTRAATEAFFLMAEYVFGELGYRRLEWKCDDRNEPSKRAAARFGFRHEGLFRQHMVVKERNRDTAWFAMTDADWRRWTARYEAWLDPANFDVTDRQRSCLARAGR